MQCDRMKYEAFDTHEPPLRIETSAHNHADYYYCFYYHRTLSHAHTGEPEHTRTPYGIGCECWLRNHLDGLV